MAAYLPFLGAPFVFDDLDGILLNPEIRSLALRGESPARTPVDGRPLTAWTFALNYALGGLEPFGYRAVNVALHAVNALLLLALLRRALPSPAAAFAAALWALHPLQTSAVTYVIQRGEALAALSALGTLACLARHVETGRPLWARLSFLACLLGMAAKEIAVVVPVLALLVDSVLWAGSWREALRLRKGFYLALASTWAVLAACVLGGHQGSTESFRLGLWAAVRTQPGVLLHYASLVLWPWPLVIDYGWRPGGAVLLPGLAVAGAAALAVGGLRTGRRWAVLPAAFLLLLAPSSLVAGLVDPAFQHRMYLPLACAAAGLGTLLARSPRRGGAVLACLGALTLARNAQFGSPATVWGDAVRDRPRNYRAWNNLGAHLQVAAGWPASERAFRASLALNPADPFSWYNVGMVEALRGNRKAAVSMLTRSVLLKPDQPFARFNLGILLWQDGERARGIEEVNAAVAMSGDPRFVVVLRGMLESPP